MQFGDGSCWWYWHGVQVIQQIIEQPETLTPAEIEDERNVAVRRVMLDRFGLGRYLREAGAELIHKDEFGRLWRTMRVIPGYEGEWRRAPEGEPLVMVEVRELNPRARRLVQGLLPPRPPEHEDGSRSYRLDVQRP